MFSQTVEYALRVVVFLATRGSSPATTRQIAAATRVPEGYLAKVLQELSRAGFIRSQRGLHGGSTLARPPEQITIFAVVDAVDPIKRIRTCPLGIKSHGVNLCPLHKRMDESLGLVEKALRESTVAELLAEEAGSAPLCEVPAAEAPAAPAPAPKLVTVAAPRKRR